MEELSGLELEEHSITEVYQLYKENFKPTLPLVRAVKSSFDLKKISIEEYNEVLSDYVEWYNVKFSKDIDNSFVENRLRVEDEEDFESEDLDESEMKEFAQKANLMISEVIRYERHQQRR